MQTVQRVFFLELQSCNSQPCMHHSKVHALFELLGSFWLTIQGKLEIWLCLGLSGMVSTGHWRTQLGLLLSWWCTKPKEQLHSFSPVATVTLVAKDFHGIFCESMMKVNGSNLVSTQIFVRKSEETQSTVFCLLLLLLWLLLSLFFFFLWFLKNRVKRSFGIRIALPWDIISGDQTQLLNDFKKSLQKKFEATVSEGRKAGFKHNGNRNWQQNGKHAPMESPKELS